MQPLALSRNWLLIPATMLVMVGVVHFENSARHDDPLSPYAKVSPQKAPGVSLQEAISLIEEGALVIDVRDGPKTHIPGALLIPLEVLNAHLSKLEAAKARSIVVYCGDGSTRGPQAAHILTQAGFAHVVNLAPGIEGWRAAGMPVAAS
jgi:rhodanese-related sulfurtransferase